MDQNGYTVAQPPSGTFAGTYALIASGRFSTRGNNVAAYDDDSNTAGGAGAAWIPRLLTCFTSTT